jgi:hypothetical protein
MNDTQTYLSSKEIVLRLMDIAAKLNTDFNTVLKDYRKNLDSYLAYKE